MAYTYINAKFSIIPPIFAPTLTALFTPSLPFTIRWRTLFLQPINILAAILTAPQWLFNNNYSVIHIPTRSGPKRCLVFQPARLIKPPGPQPPDSNENKNGNGLTKLRPLHIDIHGGGWIGGYPEQHCRLNTLIAQRTGAVVVSVTYRIAPRYIYPGAHEDVEDITNWLLDNAADRLDADVQRMTIGGGSVGACLGLGICQYLDSRSTKQQEQREERGVVSSESADEKDLPLPLGFIGICPALDFRQPPDGKPRPANYPTSDPLSCLVPLFDIYAGTYRPRDLHDTRLHSILASPETMPDDILIVAAGIDILLHEALVFSERMKVDEGKRVECVVVEKGFHGFVELPNFVLEKERLEVFEKVIEFLKDVYRRAGFDDATSH